MGADASDTPPAVDRASLAAARRVIVKLGSRTLAADGAVYARLADAVVRQAGGVPSLHENGAVAVEEIKFRDNDQLAAVVAAMVGADLLVLLSDVEGLLDATGARISRVEDAADAVRHVRFEKADGV